MPTLGLLLSAGLLTCCGAVPRRPTSLTILVPDDIESLDPNSDVEAVTDSVLANVFEPLVAFDDRVRIGPALAEAWENPEPERWRLRLRAGVRFEDGTPLSAPLVRDLLLRVRESRRLEASFFASQIKEITAPDDETIDIVTREPRALLSNLPTLYVAKPNAPGAFPPFLGTGPYRITEWTKGERIVLERSATFRGPPPTWQKATFIPVTDAAERLERLEQGAADIAYRMPPVTPGEPLPADVSLLRRASLSSYYLGMDVRPVAKNPFQDVRVRRAMYLAIDRPALVRDVLHGAGRALNQPVSPIVFGFDPELPTQAADPERARSLLAQAGYPAGFAAQLDFARWREAVARALKRDLAGVGIRVELDPLDSAAFVERLKTGRSALFFVGWGVPSAEASELFEFCLHTPTDRFGYNNYGGYSNARLDVIAETNAAVLDQRRRQRLLQEAARIVMDELPILPLFSPDDSYGVRGPLRVVPRADGEIRIAQVEPEGR
jgi:peptide/nickel transport system substrate-binding protein